MTKGQKYLEALKSFDDWTIVSDWAYRVGEMYPDLLETANQQAAGHANETTGLRELAARISSRVSTGGFGNDIEIDDSERPRKVRYATELEKQARAEHELEEDIEPLTRAERIRKDSESLTVHEEYRIGEFEAISKQLNRFFGLDFEVDHAEALLNPSEPGKHHPDNLQLLIKAHNGKKNKSNWQRFSFEEQKDYIETVIKLQKLVVQKFGIEITSDILDSLIARLEKVY